MAIDTQDLAQRVQLLERNIQQLQEQVNEQARKLEMAERQLAHRPSKLGRSVVSMARHSDY
ncbi:hypothetical protein SAMN05192583_1413 [Sphingomonas gellani]|uniref:SlyX protein n=1 Tax=Sphingomonas gellani TaxID=1166340 RepID=A0A1H8C1I4_9SPHN|nr:hypothetical protein [Sphingomonas gellani]SEM88852.1 hypothetical protein SAMN05192583_1413 [Sphingomonas gellani]